MAIPDGNMSAIPVEGTWYDPDGPPFRKLTPYEAGPIAVEDTSQGLRYQTWYMQWDSATGNLRLKSLTTLADIFVTNIPIIKYLTFTFDQNAQLAYTYNTGTSSYMYWYDSAEPGFVLTDLGADVITPSIFLDDKRARQSSTNDTLLWYTKDAGDGTWTLYMKRQRDRFLTEYEMTTGLLTPYIKNAGMAKTNRVQIALASRLAAI